MASITSSSPSLDLPLISPSDTLFNIDNTNNMSDSQQYLKLEDLHSSSPPSNSPNANFSQTSPAPVIVHSRPAKKRKSWGQELPEPKTTLPPRKRAKTDDEKEQRRIERIKRNRAAAHNSRERKRHETETLAVALARANAELEAYRNLHGPLPASIVLPEVTLSTDSADTPAPSLIDSHGSERASSPVSPTDSHMIYDMTKIKIEPNDSHASQISFSLPPAFDNLDAKSSLLPLDLTQHSAAMLCDLPCRSSGNQQRNVIPSVPNNIPLALWARLFFTLMTLQLQTYSKTLLMALWSLSPLRMARLMQASTLRLTSPSTTSSMTPLLPLLRLMATAHSNVATGHLTAKRSAPVALARMQRLSSDEVGLKGVKSESEDFVIKRKALGKSHGQGDDDAGGQ